MNVQQILTHFRDQHPDVVEDWETQCREAQDEGTMPTLTTLDGLAYWLAGELVLAQHYGKKFESEQRLGAAKKEYALLADVRAALRLIADAEVE